MYVFLRNTVGSSHNVYRSWAILRASLISFHSNRAFSWPLTVTGNNITNLSLQANCPILLPDFNQIWMFSTDFRESPQISNFTEIRPVGAALVCADRWTDQLTSGHDDAGRRFSRQCVHARK